MSKMACILICPFSILLASHLFYLILLSQGFSTKIIHRDSPDSPLYQSNLSNLKAFLRDIETSKIRASNLRKFEMENSTFLPANSTLDMGIGIPPIKTTLVFYTAAPLTWTQCEPCLKCFKQDYPIFEPTVSISYKTIRRNHNLASWFSCTLLDCYYHVETRGGPSSQGIVSMETFSFLGSSKNNKQLPTDVVFGCGTNNHGRLGPQTTLITGILGMGNFPTSLVRQLGNRITHRFSCCLPALKSSRTKTAVLSFGQEAVINGENVQTMPSLRLQRSEKLLQGTYGLNLTGISVAGKRLKMPEGSFDGGCIVDTGAPSSFIEEQAYKVVLNAFSSYFAQFNTIQKIVNGKYPKNLCYKYPKDFRNFPSMILNFEGAKLEVNGTSLFMLGRNLFLTNFICLQFLGEPRTNILGVYQQQNVRLLNDLGKNKLSFVRENW